MLESSATLSPIHEDVKVVSKFPFTYFDTLWEIKLLFSVVFSSIEGTIVINPLVKLVEVLVEFASLFFLSWNLGEEVTIPNGSFIFPLTLNLVTERWAYKSAFSWPSNDEESALVVWASPYKTVRFDVSIPWSLYPNVSISCITSVISVGGVTLILTDAVGCCEKSTILLGELAPEVNVGAMLYNPTGKGMSIHGVW